MEKKPQYLAGKTLKIICIDYETKQNLNRDWCSKFLLRMARIIGMTPIAGPYSVTFKDNNCSDKEGTSAVLIIAESHIAVHIWENMNAARIVIDSCKDFDEDLIESELVLILEPKQMLISDC